MPNRRRSLLDPKARHARLINLVASLVRDGTRTPSVIIIEDIHWLDEASIEFVSALVNVAHVSRALLILTYRPTYLAPWKDGRRIPGNPARRIARRGCLGADPGFDRRSSFHPRDLRSHRRAKRRQSILCRGVDPVAGRQRRPRRPARKTTKRPREPPTETVAGDRSIRDRRAHRSPVVRRTRRSCRSARRSGGNFRSRC